METHILKMVAENNGYKSAEDMIKEKCPSEIGYIDYGELGEYCAGEYNKKICTKCWKDATSPEDIEANIMADENETLILTRKAFDTDEDYMEYLNKLKETSTISIIEDDNAAEKQHEAVDHPKHYQGKNECIDVMRAMFGDEAVKAFCKCNAFKYRFRSNAKNGEEDIKKAEWYETYLLEKFS